MRRFIICVFCLLVLILIPFGGCRRSPRSSNSPYQMWNYTWQIINQAGDIVSVASSIASEPSWPTLEVDLCQLALGAHEDWGMPSIFAPQSKAPEIEGGRRSAGCATGVGRAALKIYVCPGTHRDWSLNHKCSFSQDYFCASWGCETTGDAYWNPSSSWDYIRVKRKKEFEDPRLIPSERIKPCLSSNQTTKGWCLPLNITFTEQAKTKDWSGRGFEWGLRVYRPGLDGKDWGLTFRTYVVASNNSYFACSTGLTTYVITSTFLKDKDYCVQVSLFPLLAIHSPEQFLGLWDKKTSLVIIVVLCTVGPCVINRFVAFLKRRMDSIQMFLIQQQYVALRNLDP